MAFQDILAAIDIVTGPDPAHSILAFSIVVGLFLLWLRKQALARFYKAGIYVAALASDALFASVKLSLLWLAGVASPFLALSLFALLVNYFWCAQQLDDIVDKADPSLPECDYVAAFRLMNSVDRDRLSRMQLTCLDKDRIFCNIYLGNNGVAKRMLENENLEPAFRHFALHIIADAACDRAGSQAELESALAEKTDKTDPFITVQLWHNRAISYVVNGQFKVADDEFKKTYREAKRLGVRNTQYKKIFGQDGNLEAYYRAASLGKQVCLRFPQIKRDLEGSQISDIRFYVIMGVASILSKKDNLTFGDIEKLDLDKLSDEIIQEVADMVLDVYLALGGTSKTAKSYAMATKVREKISLQLP